MGDDESNSNNVCPSRHLHRAIGLDVVMPSVLPRIPIHAPEQKQLVHYLGLPETAYIRRRVPARMGTVTSSIPPDCYA